MTNRAPQDSASIFNVIEGSRGCCPGGAARGVLPGGFRAGSPAGGARRDGKGGPQMGFGALLLLQLLPGPRPP